jgi:acetyltransferase
VAEAVSVAKALALCSLATSNDIGVLTHTAGPSIAMLDMLSTRDCQLAQFTDKTMTWLEEKFAGIPVVLKNPVDALIVGYTEEGYGQVADKLMADEQVGLLIAIHALHRRLKFAVPRLIASQDRHRKPVIACYISDQSGVKENRDFLQDAGIPCYTTIEGAAWGAAGCIRYKRILDGKRTSS